MNKGLLKKIKEKRVSAGISGWGLAKLTGLSPTAIYKIEDGNTPSVSTCAIILEKLGVKIKALQISDYLKTKRIKHKMSLQKLAAICRISYVTLHKIESGEVPSFKTCCRLAKELNMPLENFIEWSDKKNNKDF